VNCFIRRCNKRRADDVGGILSVTKHQRPCQPVETKRSVYTAFSPLTQVLTAVNHALVNSAQRFRVSRSHHLLFTGSGAIVKRVMRVMRAVADNSSPSRHPKRSVRSAFGGLTASGMGAHHGSEGFRTSSAETAAPAMPRRDGTARDPNTRKWRHFASTRRLSHEKPPRSRIRDRWTRIEPRTARPSRAVERVLGVGRRDDRVRLPIVSEELDALLARSIDGLSMAEIIRLQDLLSGELKRRFGRQLALAFSDVVGSTAHFARFGDEAGRRLQQRHVDLLGVTVPQGDGRVVDTAGDGAFVVYPSVDQAVGSLVALQKAITDDNLNRSYEDQLSVRIGVHWGDVLTDGSGVTGDAVNLAARVTATAEPGEIRVTRDVHREFSTVFYRLNSRSLGKLALKGISRPTEVFALEWRDRMAFPDSMRILETGEQRSLPAQSTIRFGRLRELDGAVANEVVLALPSDADTRKISRWQFELRRHPTALVLRSVSDGATEVDGKTLAKGEEAAVRAGSRIRVARVLTIELFTRDRPEASDATVRA